MRLYARVDLAWRENSDLMMPHLRMNHAWAKCLQHESRNHAEPGSLLTTKHTELHPPLHCSSARQWDGLLLAFPERLH